MKQDFSVIEYLRVIRKRWPLVIALPLIAAILTTVYYTFMVPAAPYEAFATVQIGKKIGDQNGRELYYLGQANQQLVTTFVNIAKTNAVMEKVSAALPDKPNPDDLMNQVSASAIKGTELVSISVQDQDAQRAALIANETVKAFETRLTEIESADILQVVDQATVPKARLSIDKKNRVVLAGLLGLMSSVLLAFLLEFASNARTRPNVKRK